MNLEDTVKGRCHCGAVRFAVSGGVGVINCHCEDCRRMHGNYNPMLAGPASNVRFESQDTLTWYDSSGSAQRGFCGSCGSRLFKRAGDRMMVSMGCLEDTGLRTMKNIWVESKGSWYDVPEVEDA
jgi:hypothetical protein